MIRKRRGNEDYQGDDGQIPVSKRFRKELDEMGVDKLLGFQFNESAENEEKLKKVFDHVCDKDDPDGPTFQYVAKDMQEAMDIAAAITYFHGEAEVKIDDDTGEITVFSHGKGKGRMSSPDGQ